jgi:type III secretion system YscD/HrpQ family protein
MSGYLIAEEGPLAGTEISLLEDKPSGQWTLGRDPDLCDVLLEDPMVSRKHAVISLTPEGFSLENLSSVNPATQNGKVIEGPVLLKEGDILQIGSTFFRFTEHAPAQEIAEEKGPRAEESTGVPPEEPETVFGVTPETRWLLKVITGPNTGAEFAMQRGKSYLIGKDTASCDIIFQDLSVSRQHARLSVDAEENVSIEDLNSRNGVIVNGELISDKRLLSSQDLIALGTTSFVVIDRKQARETIVAPPAFVAAPTAAGAGAPEKAAVAPSAAIKPRRDWKELIIPKRHLIVAAAFSVVILLCLFGMFSLFKSEKIVVKQVDESQKIREVIAKFPAVQFSFNQNTGKLFLLGHVLTTVEKQELTYLVKGLPFVEEIEDNVIVDELVWKSMNDLLSTNPHWIGVSVYGPQPGKFVLRGYLPTLEEQTALIDYINLNFPYLDKLENQVVVEKNLQMEIQSMLTEHGYLGVSFQLSNGEVVLTGRVEESKHLQFEHLLKDMKKLPGVRLIKNLSIVTSGEASQIDLSSQYAVTGYSKRDEKDFFVVINGHILGQGDELDGMQIVKVEPKSVILEKDGLKYRINYNLQ